MRELWQGVITSTELATLMKQIHVYTCDAIAQDMQHGTLLCDMTHLSHRVYLLLVKGIHVPTCHATLLDMQHDTLIWDMTHFWYGTWLTSDMGHDSLLTWDMTHFWYGTWLSCRIKCICCSWSAVYKRTYPRISSASHGPRASLKKVTSSRYIYRYVYVYIYVYVCVRARLEKRSM